MSAPSCQVCNKPATVKYGGPVWPKEMRGSWCEECEKKMHQDRIDKATKERDDYPFGGMPPPPNIPPRRTIDVHGREEHEAILKDPAKCKELGLDIYYETMVYLKRWGGWLNERP